MALDVIFPKDDDTPRFMAGGSCGNVLMILSHLGWNSFPIVRLGNDPEGKRIIDDMRHWGVKTRFVRRDPDLHSPRIIERMLPGKTPRHRFHLKCAHGKWLPKRRSYTVDLLTTIRHRLPKSRVYYFDRANRGTLEMAKIFKKQGATIMFEPPKFRKDDIFTQCLEISDILKHSHMQPHGATDNSIRAPIEIETMGEHGLRYRAEFLGKEWQHMDSLPVTRLVDAAGSGDWLTAGFIHMLNYRGFRRIPGRKKLEHSLRFGQALASLNCGFVGARGMMYALRRPLISSLAERMVSSRRVPDMKDFLKPSIDTNPAISYGCRICLCTS